MLTLEERRRSLLSFIASAGVCKVSAIPREYFHRGVSELGQYVRRGLLFMRGSGLNAVCAVRDELLPPEREEVSGVHRLPMFEAGAGERRDDCTQYDGCLTRYLRDGKHDNTPAQCPAGCWAYTPIPSHVRHAMAHANVAMSKPGPTL